MLEIVGFDSSDPFSVVGDFRPGLDQRVKHDIPVEVNDWNSGEALTLLRLDPLTVKRQDFSLSRYE